MQSWINFNGSFMEENMPVVTAGNRGLRYGDGLFETMRCINGEIHLKELHFKRLFDGMELLGIRLPALIMPALLEDQVKKTLVKNKIGAAARIRLMVFRGDGGLYETDGKGGGYLIQVWPLPVSALSINENGLVLGVYDGAMKACDALANIKSNNFLVYAMAALHAKQHRLNDCLVLNTHGRVSDSTIANVFWISKSIIHTPPLKEGGIAGVMRSHLLTVLPLRGYPVAEKQTEMADLLAADEVFLTNAIYGLRWVKTFCDKTYGNETGKKLFSSTI